jgi:hypothetical protein
VSPSQMTVPIHLLMLFKQGPEPHRLLLKVEVLSVRIDIIGA